MKPHLDIKHTGNVDADDRVRMTFDENSIAHLMSVLTDLYSDPETAVIREYSTNAYDAHRAAGHTDPIEVSLPTVYEPLFRIRDHGIGMTAEEILGQFSKYGFSSKRDSDEEVGMLGLGCKSGLTYTSQFTLVAIRDGVKNTVLVTREADGAGAVQVVNTESVSEPNGVEVLIPVKHVQHFNRKVHEFYLHWEPGSVLVDGAPADSFWDDPEAHGALALDDDVLLWPKGSGEQPDIIVMGNVPYPIPWSDEKHRLVVAEDDTHYGRAMRAVVRVPIGAVNFTPSREALHYTKRTEETCADARKFIRDVTFRRAQEKINACTTFAEALRLSFQVGHLSRLVTDGSRRQFTFRGLEIPTGHAVWPKFVTHTTTDKKTGKQVTVVDESERERAIYSWFPSRDGSSKNSIAKWRDLMGEGILHVVGYTGKALYQGAKRKTRIYADNTFGGHEIKMVYFYPNSGFLDPWLDGCNVVQWATIEAVQIPKEERERSSSRSEKYIRLVRHGGGWKEVSEIDTSDGKPLVFVEANTTQTVVNIARSACDIIDATLVSCLKVDRKKLMRSYPQTLPLKDWLAKAIVEMTNDLTEVERFMLDEEGRNFYDRNENERQLQVSCFTDFLPIHADEFLDPEVVLIVRMLADGPERRVKHVSDRRQRLSNYRNLVNACRHFGISVPKVPATDLRERVIALQKKYPLIKVHRSHFGAEFKIDTRDFIQYVNETYSYLTRPYGGENY